MPQRLTDRTLPQYRHVPGRTPHPTRHPDGHSFEVAEFPLPSLNQFPWQDCEQYHYGVDLFNEGYWWECHEVLEALWHAAGIGTPAGHVLQAIIQCAAAHLKTRTGQLNGARRLLDHARKHVIWAGDFNLGFDNRKLIRDTDAFINGNAPDPAYLILILE